MVSQNKFQNSAMMFLLLALTALGILATGCPGKSAPAAPSNPAPTPTNTAFSTPPTATQTPTVTTTRTPANTPTVTSTGTPTLSPTLTPTATSTATPTLTATSTITQTPTSTASPTATRTPTITPTHTATSTFSPTATDTATATATPTFHFLSGGSWVNTSPYGLACNKATSVVYVTQPSDVEVFNSITNFTTASATWTQYGTTAFIYPQTQAVNPVNGNVYVVDGGSGGAQVVYQFTSAGATVNKSTTAFNTIQDVETDSNGNAYVVDQGGATLYELNSSMGVVKTWTAAGTTSFGSLFSVALDASNNIYVCDNGSSAGHNHIWEMNYSGTVLNTWNTPVGNFIYQMCVNASGTVYAADEGVVGLEEYVPGIATPAHTFTGSEGGGTAFSIPDGVCFLPNGNLLVADSGINYLQEYVP